MAGKSEGATLGSNCQTDPLTGGIKPNYYL